MLLKCPFQSFSLVVLQVLFCGVEKRRNRKGCYTDRMMMVIDVDVDDDDDDDGDGDGDSLDFC